MDQVERETDQPVADQPTERNDLADELHFECEQCKIIQEEMEMFFEADGLTYTQADE